MKKEFEAPIRELQRQIPQAPRAPNAAGESETALASAPAPSDPSAELPSKGSRHHAQPCLKICRMYQRDGTCHYGTECEFCHFDHHESIPHGPRRIRNRVLRNSSLNDAG